MKAKSKILQKIKILESNSQKSYTAKPIFNDDYSINHWRILAVGVDTTISNETFCEWAQEKGVVLNFEDVSTEVLKSFIHSSK
ncbi:TPA: hypothetical protein ACGO9D_000875 [Streptococcus suis]